MKTPTLRSSAVTAALCAAIVATCSQTPAQTLGRATIVAPAKAPKNFDYIACYYAPPSKGFSPVEVGLYDFRFPAGFSAQLAATNVTCTPAESSLGGPGRPKPNGYYVCYNATPAGYLYATYRYLDQLEPNSASYYYADLLCVPTHLDVSGGTTSAFDHLLVYQATFGCSGLNVSVSVTDPYQSYGTTLSCPTLLLTPARKYYANGTAVRTNGFWKEYFLEPHPYATNYYTHYSNVLQSDAFVSIYWPTALFVPTRGYMRAVPRAH